MIYLKAGRVLGSHGKKNTKPRTAKITFRCTPELKQYINTVCSGVTKKSPADVIAEAMQAWALQKTIDKDFHKRALIKDFI